MTYYELWQLEKYGDILPVNNRIGFFLPPKDFPEDDYENDIENLRTAEFMETMAELQRVEDEN